MSPVSPIIHAKRGNLHIKNGVFEGVNSATLARNVYDLMRDHGEWEGEGCYQKVYTFPSIDGVIKVNIGDYPAAHYAISLAPKLSNPHVPQLIKYYGTFVHPELPPNWGMKPRVWVYQVERLESCRLRYELGDSLSWSKREDYDGYAADVIHACNMFIGDNCKIGEAVLRLRDWAKTYAKRTGQYPRLDLHSGNWMQRPGSNDVVLNDPVAAPAH